MISSFTLLDRVGVKPTDRVREITSTGTKMHGHKGWKNFEEFIETANQSTDWVVLRNFEFLPNNFFGNDKDVDVLCNDVRQFAKIMKMTKRSWGMAAYETVISNEKVAFDIRQVGDGYYDRQWQADILDRKCKHLGLVPRPDNEDYFYSLLYHSKIHKNNVKPRYARTLADLGKEIGLGTLDAAGFHEDRQAARLIEAFLNRNNYKIEYCSDTNVTLNTEFLKTVSADLNSNTQPTKYRPPAYYLTAIYEYTPKSLISRLPMPIKSFIKKLFKV